MQALGFQYSVMSAAEPDQKCRDFVYQNCDRPPTHWFPTIQAQMQSMESQRACVCHPWSADGCCAAPETADLGIMGAPCHPFSTQRAKRYVTGSVAQHPEYDVMCQQVIRWLEVFEPRVVVLEQVEGFDEPEDKNDESTPFRRLLGLRLIDLSLIILYKLKP